MPQTDGDLYRHECVFFPPKELEGSHPRVASNLYASVFQMRC